MEPACVNHAIIPGSSKLFLDFLYHFDRVERFYGIPFNNLDELGKAASAVRYPDSRREAIVRLLRKQNGDSAALSQLAQPGTVAVVTGQQVGLFSGPAYTVFKALTAVKLADALRKRGIPAVPVFWLATTDHDFAEVDHAWVFDEHANPTKVSVTSAVTNGGPVGSVELKSIPAFELGASLGNLPFRDVVLDKIEAAYHPGVTLGSGFHAFLKDILNGFGLLYLDPLPKDVREVAGDFMQDVIDRAPELVEAVRKRNRELIEAGYHAQVLVEEDTSLLFLLDQHRRTPIRWKDGRFVTKDRSYTAAELKAIADRVSANALLRPVLQDYLLPTISYVGGPAEIAYLAQSEVLYRSLLDRMPVVFPRNGFTLLDGRADKLLDRYALSVPSLFDYGEKIKSHVARKLVPPGLAERFDKLHSAMDTEIADIRSELAHFDSTLECAAKKSGTKILYQIDKLRRKVANASLQRDERATRDAAYLTNLIYPHRRLQERFYSIVPFLAKHGLDLPQRLLDEVQLACPDHMVRTV